VRRATGQAMGKRVGVPGPIMLQGTFSRVGFKDIEIRPLP